MTIQSNTGGADPSTVVTGGGLATASAGFSGTPDDQVSTVTGGQSFDMLFALPQTTAVSFTPLIFDVAASGDAGTATIRVYDDSNTLIGTLTDAPVAGFMAPTTTIGVIATNGDVIDRINVFATSTDDLFSGADDINVYTGVVPVDLMHFEVD